MKFPSTDHSENEQELERPALYCYCLLPAFSHWLRTFPRKLQVEAWRQARACAIRADTRLHPCHHERERRAVRGFQKVSSYESALQPLLTTCAGPCSSMPAQLYIATGAMLTQYTGKNQLFCSTSCLGHSSIKSWLQGCDLLAEHANCEISSSATVCTFC